MPHPSPQPHMVGVGWGGEGEERGGGWPGVGHWEGWALEEPRVHMQQKYICEYICTHMLTPDLRCEKNGNAHSPVLIPKLSTSPGATSIRAPPLLKQPNK